MLSVTRAGDCCGVGVVYGFPSYFSYGTAPNVGAYEVDVRIKMKRCRKGMLLINLTYYQTQHYEEMLLRLGWVALPKTQNPNTSNVITTYYYRRRPV